jgi:hypothetical protein
MTTRKKKANKKKVNKKPAPKKKKGSKKKAVHEPKPPAGTGGVPHGAGAGALSGDGGPGISDPPVEHDISEEDDDEENAPYAGDDFEEDEEEEDVDYSGDLEDL